MRGRDVRRGCLVKRAFTLIELLVVIAIVAVLAAILFPVFAQAKTAAKKTAAISNQKQISLGLLLYVNDADDLYPRQDSCAPDSSLNPDLNGAAFPANGVGLHCTTGDYRYRINHFSWQKYIRPYSRTTAIFEHPLREKDSEQWRLNGQIAGSFALNIGFTGAHDTQGRPEHFLRKNRLPFLGGSPSGFPDPARAAILLEIPGTTVALAPSMSNDAIEVGDDVTVYPVGVREFWRYKLMKGTVVDCINRTSGVEPDPKKISGDGVVLGFADGSAKFVSAGEFLARTPTKRELFGASGSSHTAGWAYGNDCATPPGNLGFYKIDTTVPYPMWGFGGQ